MRLLSLSLFLAFFHLLGSVPTLLAQAKTRINGTPVVLDSQGKLLSWVRPQEAAYDRVVRLGWEFIKNKVPVESNGLKTYLTYSTFDPATLHGTDWPHNPAGLYAMFVDSGLGYYAYAGDTVVLERVREMLDYQLAHGTTPPDWDWASVPYASSDAGALKYFGADDTYYCGKRPQGSSPCGRGDGHYAVEPDKIGELGVGYLKFYELTGEAKYRDAALACANALAAHLRAGDLIHSPWPFRIFAHTNIAREEYTAEVIGPIKLFDELVRLSLGNVAAYQRARKLAWEWLMAFPMKNNLWNAYFEDIPIDVDLVNWNQYSALETARYLLLHPETDAEWKAHAAGLIAWVEKTFAVDVKATEHYRWVQQEPIQYGQQWGANIISEQSRYDMDKMGSHTSRYASLCALYYERTGEESFKEKAFRSFNWATYMAHEDGLITEAIAEENFWFSDGYADYVRHFLAGMGSAPEWAPPGESHLVQSTSVVQRVEYAAREVRYTTFDNDSREVLRLAFTPTRVTADGVALTRLPRSAGAGSDFAATGWSFDPSRGALHIRHAGAKNVVVSGQ